MALQLKIRPWKKPEEMQQLKDHRFLLIKSRKNHLSSPTQQYPLSQTPKKSQLANIHLPIIPVSHPILVTISSVTKRRTFNFSIFTLILSEFLPVTTINAIADDVKEETKDELEMYVDSEEGFTLLIPSSYMKVNSSFLFMFVGICVGNMTCEEDHVSIPHFLPVGLWAQAYGCPKGVHMSGRAGIL